ncbi:hypothetical protein BDV59DRAFT_189276 [Aspergillus ambiguus]|uniref:uncharacterized protein n=1 Tax=Aspergillus ambiguus TaxID=176160 RepID=UPI003CCCFFE6
MAILDKENRRLRMPSLSAMKLQKKSTPPSPESPPRKDLPAYPARGDSVPVRPPRPQEKELPPDPMLHSLSPTSSPPSSTPPAPFTNPIHPYNDRPLPSFPRVPVPKPTDREPVSIQQSTPPPSDGSEPEAEREQRLPEEPRSQPQQPPREANLPPKWDTPVATPRTDPQPGEEHAEEPPSDDAQDPLEDYIPDPEPELDGPGDGGDDDDAVEEDTGPWTPPDYDPVAAPLNKLHFSCYQEHRAMLPANNQWYPLPCMTCQKFDREMRFRCVFCCLRVCGGCLEGLRKCPRRSLAQLMETMSAAEPEQTPA